MTAFFYQGFACQSFEVNRSRGFSTDLSWATIPLASFPRNFDLSLPKPGGVLAALRVVTPSPPGVAGVPQQPRRFEFGGTLYVESGGHTLTVHPLFILAVDRVRESGRDSGSESAMVRLTLVDSRYFWGRGFLRRWSFNRAKAVGTTALDSVKPGGDLFSRGEIAQQVVSAECRTPTLSHYPPRWDESKAAHEFAPASPALLALADLVKEGGAEDPCLRWDDTVALHSPAEGQLGYARDGKGPNDRPLPPDLRLYKAGAGEGYTITANYPDDFVVVRGGLRVRTIEVEAEPALAIRGQSVPLNEETVRELTGGRYGIEWLQEFVLKSAAYQSAFGLPSEVVSLLRSQAWRVYRPVGVEVLERFRADLGKRGVFERTDLVSKPGPRADLLPILPRAESEAGRRRTPSAVASGFRTVHHARFDLDVLREELRQRKQRLREILKRVDAIAAVQGKGFPTANQPTPKGRRAIIERELRRATWDDLARMNRQVDLIERIRGVSPAFAGDYERNLRDLYQLKDDTSGGVNSELYAFAKEIRGDEALIASLLGEKPGALALVDLLDRAEKDARAREFGRLLNDKIRKRLDELDRLAKEREKPEATGERRAKAVRARTRLVTVNLPEHEDTAARVISAEQGLVKLSHMGGHLKDDGVPIPSATTFVPLPVKLRFGAHIRPGGGEPGTTAARTTEPDIPSWYLRAFRRGEDRTPQPVPLSDVPPGEGVVIPRPDLVELIPLEGGGNAEALDQTAFEVAAGRFLPRERVESAAFVMAHPWPIQCDGVVRHVRIRSRSTPVVGTGIETLVEVGTGSSPPLLGRTRERPRGARGERDAAKREGLSD